jgi:hypothetical protein
MTPLVLFFASLGASILVESMRPRRLIGREEALRARREVLNWVRSDPHFQRIELAVEDGSYVVVVWGTFRRVTAPVEVLGVPVRFRSTLPQRVVTEDDETDEFGELPPPAVPTSTSVLQSAALAQPGSWTQRNVLQAGAQTAWQRRLAGTADEADWAVLRAARPGIASSRSGPISAGWSRSPWTPEDEEGSVDIGDAVLEEMGL